MSAISRESLPVNLYSSATVRKLDALAIDEYKIAGYELMKRAGKAVFKHLQSSYPLAKRLLICCGSGNNAGDGYVIAWLATRAGYKVNVISLAEPHKLQGDAKMAFIDWRALGHQLLDHNETELQKADVVVDALLGSGIDRDVTGEWAILIQQINKSGKPVISVDVPSGLDADTGQVRKYAIRASSTVTFIGMKKGLLTNQGVEYAGDINFQDLGVSEKLYKRVAADAQRLHWPELKRLIHARGASVHKHQCGHVFILGGDLGMPGAVRMAAEAALRAGAGLVTVVSHGEHAAVVLAGRPEIMFQPCADGVVTDELLDSASTIVVGPGLGDSNWSKNMLTSALMSKAFKVIDAGALRLLDAKELQASARLNPGKQQNWVLTPHAGEAAGLLDVSSEDIQNARFSSVQLIQEKFGGHILLKGPGSLLLSPAGLSSQGLSSSGQKTPIIQLCPYGNPGMASAGMGDVLSGVLAAMICQGYAPELACRLGLCIHSIAADCAAVRGETGMLASDLFEYIRQLVNPAK